MNELIKQLRHDFPALHFAPGDNFSWSPKDQVITYTPKRKTDKIDSWSLIHEVGHGLLGHQDYHSDFELLLLEAAAWEKAVELGAKYNVEIDENHIQDCLDTYRDWLHRRSTCPTCSTQSLQSSPTHYTCFNCKSQWQVSPARFCRPYRRIQKEAAR